MQITIRQTSELDSARVELEIILEATQDETKPTLEEICTLISHVMRIENKDITKP